MGIFEGLTPVGRIICAGANKLLTISFYALPHNGHLQLAAFVLGVQVRDLSLDQPVHQPASLLAGELLALVLVAQDGSDLAHEPCFDSLFQVWLDLHSDFQRGAHEARVADPRTVVVDLILRVDQYLDQGLRRGVLLVFRVQLVELGLVVVEGHFLGQADVAGAGGADSGYVGRGPLQRGERDPGLRGVVAVDFAQYLVYLQVFLAVRVLEFQGGHVAELLVQLLLLDHVFHAGVGHLGPGQPELLDVRLLNDVEEAVVPDLREPEVQRLQVGKVVEV